MTCVDTLDIIASSPKAANDSTSDRAPCDKALTLARCAHSSTPVLLMIRRAARGNKGRHEPRRAIDSFAIVATTLLLSECPSARADPSIEFSGATGFGVLTAGVTSGRFAISPSGSLGIRGEQWFFVVRDTLSFLGVTGGRFGINNETSLGGGLFWELVNVSAGLSLAEYSLPICGPRLCGQVHGFAPGASLRVDLFGPYLSGALGIAVDCSGTWITGSAAAVWSGVSMRCSAGPILRFASQH
jgi:hypothetical protein